MTSKSSAKSSRTRKPSSGDALSTASLEAYEVVEVHRSQLKNAPYNPRVLSDKARRKLQAGIKKLGLLSPPTWNVRTGNIVSGHQRVSILDSLKGTQDYTLKVARVDLDESREKEANILMNNGEAQGEWDIGKLEDMFKDTSLDIGATGFDAADIYRMFGDAPLADREGELDKLAGQLREARSTYERITSGSAGRDNQDFYLVVVFRDAGECEGFITEFGLDDNRYQSGAEIQRLLREGKENSRQE